MVCGFSRDNKEASVPERERWTLMGKVIFNPHQNSTASPETSVATPECDPKSSYLWVWFGGRDNAFQ